MTTFHPFESDDLLVLKLNDDRLLCMLNYSSYPWLIPYPLRESSETAHQVDSSPTIGVLHEYRELSPYNVAQHYTPDE